MSLFSITTSEVPVARALVIGLGTGVLLFGPAMAIVNRRQARRARGGPHQPKH